MSPKTSIDLLDKVIDTLEWSGHTESATLLDPAFRVLCLILDNKLKAIETELNDKQDKP